MSEKKQKSVQIGARRADLKDWLIGCGLSAVAAAVYFATTAGYVYPGEGAHLIALWRGLDVQTVTPYPLFSFFGRLLGGGNCVAPVFGTIAVGCLYAVVSGFVRRRVDGEFTQQYAGVAARLAGIAASLVFLFTPAVHEAATHVEPRMFDFAWALLAAIPVMVYSHAPASLAWSLPILSGVMCGLGFADTPLFLMLMPFYAVAVGLGATRRGKGPWGAVIRWFASFSIVFLVYAPTATGDFTEFLRQMGQAFRVYVGLEGWILVAGFATVPFVACLTAAHRGLNEPVSFSSWIFHSAISFVSILVVATPLAPSSLMEPYGILPVATSAFAACLAGYLLAYWFLIVSVPVRTRERGARVVAWTKPFALSAMAVLAVVFAIRSALGLFSFEKDRGAFADRAAERILSALGARTWFVTDGTLDDHVMVAAAKAGREVNLVCLNRDLDPKYLARLGETVRDKKVGGSKCDELALSLSLGVLPFVQDWFAADPTVANQVAIYGAPDLWYGAGVRPVPEFLFFGGDPKFAEKVDAVADWNTFKDLLVAPKDWGSYRTRNVKHPVDRMRLSLRRHLGLVENDRGVWLQDQKRDDEAFAAYERVLNEIDADNVSSLFNEVEMSKSHPKAAAKQKELERQLQHIVDDKHRRYFIWQLGNFYGYIRSPEIFVRLGFTWARSGRPGEALSQIRRAIEFIPTDRRGEIMNMMAALYASDSEGAKSRATYEAVLSKDANNHDALIGLMRLELVNGNSAKALEYLEKATATGSVKGARAQVEKAMVMLMKGDTGGARTILRKLTEESPSDLQAWSLLAAVTMQECDNEKNPAKKHQLEAELENAILPAMEKQSRNVGDYYVQTTKAFLLMRKGTERRKDARDAFIAAAKNRPDVAATHDLILGLDITLNDTQDAERHAREVLRRNRKAPLANYVMGSLALQRGDYRGAETFLRRAADAERPVALAMNDLAEVLRRNSNLAEAERYARKCVKAAPKLYVAWETLGSILMDAKGNLEEAEQCVLKACELSKSEKGREVDVRMVMSLARVQALKGDMIHAKTNLRKVRSRIGELTAFEKGELEELQKSVR